MALLGYKKQFAPKVESGEKRCTIRAQRKYTVKKGETLYQYSGIRTKQCRKLRQDICTKVQSIGIVENDGYVEVYIDGNKLNIAELTILAHNDGHESVFHFSEFFKKTHGLPFKGQLIHW